MKSVRIEYSTWSRFPGGDIARLVTMMQLPDDLAAQVIEAGSCDQPAGLPEAICSALEAQAMLHDVHSDGLDHHRGGQRKVTAVLRQVPDSKEPWPTIRVRVRIWHAWELSMRVGGRSLD